MRNIDYEIIEVGDYSFKMLTNIDYLKKKSLYRKRT